jgi:two-component system chemotaxis response regulator CheY
MSNVVNNNAILVVDDSASIRDMVKMTLSSAGYESHTFVDGVEALKYAEKNAVLAVVTDVNMPNMDGIELIGELRKLEHYRHTPILVLTTEKGNGKKLCGKSAGATGWIVKPFHPESLLKTIRRVVF